MMKALKKVLIIGIIFLLLAFILVNVLDVPTIILKKIYPKEYQEYIERYAQEYGVDPLLIFAIIKAESNFDPNVTSKSNAIGLMQLVETTAQETANKLEMRYTIKESLYDPETNIRLGTKYYTDLVKEYNGNYILALTAYNAGKGNVKKWIEQGIIQEDGSDVENIPFKETNTYVRKIVRDYQIYQQLYGK